MLVESTFRSQLALTKASQIDVHNFLGPRPGAFHSIPIAFLHHFLSVNLVVLDTSVYLKVSSPSNWQFCPSFVIELRVVRQVRMVQCRLKDLVPFLAAAYTSVRWQA